MAISLLSPGCNKTTGVEVDTQLTGMPSIPRRKVAGTSPRFNTVSGTVKLPPGAAANCTDIIITPTRSLWLEGGDSQLELDFFPGSPSPSD